MYTELEVNKDDRIEGSCHSLYFFVGNKGTAVIECIGHARKNGRGGGWWKEGRIYVGLIHHCDWHCLCTSRLR